MNLDPRALAALRVAQSGQLPPDRLSFYDPLRGMLPVHTSQAVLRFVRKPNQVGGTYSMGAEVWWAALDLHPHRPPIAKGAPIWVMIKNLDSEYITVCEKFWDVAPRHRLDPSCKYVPSVGFTYRGKHMIVLDNGRRIEFKSGTQDVHALESGTVAAAFVNEPPSPQHFFGLLQRTALHSAPVLMNFTPVGRPLGWLRASVEGDPAEGKAPEMPGWAVFTPSLTEADCTTMRGRVIRSAASIADQVSRMSASQRAQRQFGAWDGETIDRTFDGFTDDSITASIPRRRWEVLLGIDHGEMAGHEFVVMVLFDPESGQAFVLDEYENAETSDPDADAKGIVEMLARHEMRTADVDDATGDTNSAGKSRAGRTVNEELEELLALRIRPAIKGPGSVAEGTQVLNTALRRGLLRVHPRCVRLLASLRHWTGKDDDLKHAIDALRYIAVPRLRPLIGSRTAPILLP